VLLGAVGFLLAADRNDRGVPKPFQPSTISCQVIAWDLESKPFPQLTLACPPEGTYTPIRIYLVLSWANKGDLPEGWSRITESAKYRAKARQARGGIEVQLQCRDTRGKKSQREWILFTRMVRQAIIDPGKRF
jgi:hypothetical protein